MDYSYADYFEVTDVANMADEEIIQGYIEWSGSDIKEARELLVFVHESKMQK